MNAQIHLTDTAARIAAVEEKSGSWTVTLEWGGPSDRTITDFEISRLEGYVGKITASGGTGRTGWVILDDEPDAKIGDSIPLLPHSITLAEAAALPLETEITIHGKSPLHGKWADAETRTLGAWLIIARERAAQADHEPADSPAALLQYLVGDFAEVDFEAAV